MEPNQFVLSLVPTVVPKYEAVAKGKLSLFYSSHAARMGATYALSISGRSSRIGLPNN